MNRRVTAALIGALAALVAGCGSSDDASSRKGPGLIRAEAACTQDGLDPPKRQTLILVDARAIHKAANATEFAQQNVGFRDLVMSLADPDKAIAGGLAVPRERVTIAVVPSDGSGADIAFTGCLPGLTPDEMATANTKHSALESTFSGSVGSQMEKEADAFRLQLIGGMVAAAGKADGMPSAQSGPIAESRFLQQVRASKALWDSGNAVPRIILLSDMSALQLRDPQNTAPALSQGIAAGRTAGGDLGQAEIHIVLPVERPMPDQEFLRGYFLAQNGQLASIAIGRVTGSPPPPRRLWRFAGQAAYPSGSVPLDVRLGDDGNGKLTASWVTVLGDPRFAIPLTGQVACASPENCKIATDNNGFAQAWTGAPSSAPAFAANLPFGGMRNATFEINGTKLTCKVFDDAVTLGKNPNQNWIAVAADTKQL